MKSQLWTKEPGLFRGDSDGRVVMGDNERALQCLSDEKQGEAEREDISGRLHPSQPYDRASAKPSDSLVQVVYAEFVAVLTGAAPRAIPLDADALDLEDRADHVSRVFSALSAYLAVILDDTAQNVPGGLDLRDAEAILADLAADLTGTIQHAADGMAWLP